MDNATVSFGAFRLYNEVWLHKPLHGKRLKQYEKVIIVIILLCSEREDKI